VAGLQLTDLDWKNDSFLLRQRKNGDSALMPLALKAKEALKEYLAVRPASADPQVFLTCRAPIKPLGKSVRSVARHVSKHLGRRLRHQGAYVLRHSFAKALLDGGASLQEIGQVMGHKSLRGTGAYMMIATNDLREVAANYADLLIQENPPSCVTS
jgi:site-specific recombinase XerD